MAGVLAASGRRGRLVGLSCGGLREGGPTNGYLVCEICFEGISRIGGDDRFVGEDRGVTIHRRAAGVTMDAALAGDYLGRIAIGSIGQALADFGAVGLMLSCGRASGLDCRH